MEIQILNKSILTTDADALVNAANQDLIAGGGVCGAIFEKAGYQELKKACEKLGYCKTGDAVITKGFNLKSKYIIHAVGPHYQHDANADKLLQSAYLSSLKLADEKKLNSIAFPCISTGIFCFPLEEAAQIALDTILNYKSKYLKVCYLYCYTLEEYKTLLKRFQKFTSPQSKTISLLTEVNKFYQTYNTRYTKTPDQMREHLQAQEKAFKLLRTLQWDDIISLTKEQLQQVNPAILYDWSHISANYDKQEELQKILEDVFE